MASKDAKGNDQTIPVKVTVVCPTGKPMFFSAARGWYHGVTDALVSEWELSELRKELPQTLQVEVQKAIEAVTGAKPQDPPPATPAGSQAPPAPPAKPEGIKAAVVAAAEKVTEVAQEAVSAVEGVTEVATEVADAVLKGDIPGTHD